MIITAIGAQPKPEEPALQVPENTARPGSGARQGGTAAPFMLLWPCLLVIHAALGLAGVPPFSDEPNAVNILVPTFGYGAIAALVSHVYSRVALRRLRRLARGPEVDKTGGGRHA